MSNMLKKGNSILHEIKKLTLYAGNGIINTIVCYGLFIVISNFIDYRIAIVLVYIPGIFLSYFLNGKIVFNNKGHFLIFVVITILMMGVNVAVTWILVDAFGLSKAVSMLVAIGIVFVLGYSLNKRFSFRKRTLKTRAS
jgi:putative flippase GtrA